jgi:Ca2+-binding EF-hand superfamily protein
MTAPIRVSLPRVAGLLLALTVALPTMAADRAVPDQAEARFRLLDVNQDGVVSQYEYDSEVAFETMDSDHNASLSAAELQTMLGPMPNGEPSVADRIVPADLDGNGELDDAELRRATEMRFSWLDRNQDGNLDLAELRSGFGVRVRPGH